MGDKAWKRAERNMAKLFNTTRTGPMGKDLPDLILPDLGVEVKHMQRLSLRADHMKQARENARGNPWVLILIEAKSGRKVAVSEPRHIANMYNELRWYRERYDNEYTKEQVG